jgi:hypothetical protein
MFDVMQQHFTERSFWEANTRSAIQKISRLIWKTYIRHRVHKDNSLDSILVMWLYLTPAASLRCNSMLRSYLHLGKFSKWPLPIILFYKSSLCTSGGICYKCYKFCPLNPLGFDFYIFISCLSQWPRSLRRGSAISRLLGLWVQIPPERNGCLSLVSIVYCQIQVSASVWSLIQRSTTECDVSVINININNCPTRCDFVQFLFPANCSTCLWSWSLDNEEVLLH